MKLDFGIFDVGNIRLTRATIIFESVKYSEFVCLLAESGKK